MNTMPQRRRDSETSITPPLASPGCPTPGAAPPHLLWQTLESAYAQPQEPDAQEERLARVIAMPLVLAASLLLWVLIVEFLLTR